MLKIFNFKLYSAEQMLKIFKFELYNFIMNFFLLFEITKM